jgi:2-polyprenyl-3-methyl-5-hydroxy-6-metoxy-1,4-benzoquinol methylase
MATHTATSIPERFVPETMREELLAAEHLARYEWASALAPARRVLDAGCGTGYGSRILSTAGARHVLGADIAAAVVEAARAHESDCLEFAQADIARLPYADGSFDLITCFEVIEHVPEPGAVLAELARVLAPGGVLAISSPNADRYPQGNPHHLREFTTGEFEALLQEVFSAVRLLAQHQWVSSAVLEQRDLAPGAMSVRTVKAAGRWLGSETYTIALAGWGALPEPPPAAALTGTVEVRRWVEHFDEQRRLIEKQTDYLASLEELDAERRGLRLQLIGAEAELAEAEARAEEIAERADEAEARARALEERADALQAELDEACGLLSSVWESPSWRSTRPLRSAKRLLRRG